MKMNKLMLLILAIALVMVMPAYATNITSCTLVNPALNQFDNGIIKLNATAVWADGLNASSGISNVTFILYGNNSGLTVFSNFTQNGSRTNATAGATAIKADYTVNLVNNDLADNVVYTIVASCYNSTNQTVQSNALNSTAITYTIDSLAPTTIITNPLSGSTVVPNGGNQVMFEYTPTDTNLANCTLSLNNAIAHASTSDTTTSNMTSGSTARFKNVFGADNTSVRVAITCNDLAGLSGSSSNFTFNVLTGGLSVATRQAIAEAASGGGGGSFKQVLSSQPSSAGKAFSVAASPSGISSTHLQQYGWMYFVGAILLLILAVRFKWFK